MREYLYISQGGDAVIVEDLEKDSLGSLQMLVGGNIECVSPTALGPGVDAWVNEEGLLLENFGINLVASFITRRQLVGPMVLTGYDNQGNTTSLPSDIIPRLKREGLMIFERKMEPFEVAARFMPTTVMSGIWPE